MLSEFKKFIAENHIIKSGDRILLAVSGGIDSMVMAHLFLNLDNATAIAHCNFSLRSEESDLDEKLVRDYAEEHQIPFYSTRFETRTYAREKGLSIEMAARELRYSWFEKIRSDNNFDAIAVAHNLNDNIETLVINLIRGTGLAGLSGMKTVNSRIIRPLLFASRQDIIKYCEDNKIIYREDKTNADTSFIRNKIRHSVLPVLKEINPSIETTLNETAERFSGINEIVTAYINRLRDKITERKEGNYMFNINLLRPHLHNKAIIFELFRPFGTGSLQMNALLRVIKGKTGGQLFTNSHRIIKNRQELIVSPEELKNEAIFVVDDITGFKTIPGFEKAEYATVTDTYEIPSDPTVACIDSDKIVFPLVVRPWKAGDYFCPLGMRQKKKLSDYFIDKKYSILEKENKFILESNGNIVWIIGDRLDNRFKITKSTEKALIIKTAKKALVIKKLK